jgi:hypothetical protein
VSNPRSSASPCLQSAFAQFPIPVRAKPATERLEIKSFAN